ncbi:hypothetical protein UFOVP346_50 [uncultured Caudovirales phage]|uniref:Uncharacterized protein n=1 Tax=uncultured Caudovirales phage TaxID=2100421 RepID=A0A6J5M6L0_9CAUD|nr:hypothetical protein UFOVP346_50 [uncultured Caudovirales phage]
MASARGLGVSLTQQLRKVQEELDLVRTEFLKGLATEIVNNSPVDTGTYVMGHMVGERSAAGQFTGAIKYIGPPGQDAGAMKSAAIAKLHADIDSLPEGQTRVNISNRVAHVRIVEDGGHNWKTPGYKVYTRARDRAGDILSGVITRVRAKQ